MTPTSAAAIGPAGAVHALPAGHRLHEFELRSVIGVGGFGIVYLAFDHSLEREVAIKEYLPSAFAGRTAAQQVSVLSASHADTFALGLSSFVNEARLLARFDHPSLLKVHRFWEGNGTAYMVMPLYRGRTLRQWREHAPGRCPAGPWLLQLTEQLLGALEVLHAEGVYHRDIAPDNVIVADGAPAVLLDFGAARRVIGGRSQSLTAILKPHYAPLEQYAEASGMGQGPWTDLYALGATLHFLLTGRPPQAATARALRDDQPRLAGAAFGSVPDRLLQACDWMLALQPHERPQQVNDLRRALAGEVPVPQRVRPADWQAAQAWQSTIVQPTGAPPAAAPAAVAAHREVPAWLAANSPAPGPTLGPAPDPAPGVSMAHGMQATQPARARALPRWGAAAAVAIAAVVGAWWAWRPSAPTPAPALPAIERAAAATGGAERMLPARGVSDDATARPAHTNAMSGMSSTTASAAPSRRAPPRNEVVAPRSAAPQGGVPHVDAVRTSVPAEPVVARSTAGKPVVPVTDAQVQRNLREACGSRRLLARHRCLLRECEKPQYQSHRECRRVRDIEARSRDLLGG